MGYLPPIRRQVVVPAGAELAFEVFTAEIGRWWPVADLSVYGAGAGVAFEGDRLVERGPDGAASVWGTVLDRVPPHRLRLTWHPGADPAKASEVEVTFAEVSGELTLVTLEHRGWERFADPAAARAEYDHGWPHVLDGYVACVPADEAAPAPGPAWVALMHTRGPAVPPGTSVFAHPDFREHAAFLRRLAGRGVLVAAGPLDGAGEGMTVLRLPDAGAVAEYARLASEDDLSVVRGVLNVRVRPWRVALTG